MILHTGFPPITKTDAKVLILGSMPGQKSLAENQYYAHPRNNFWPIIYSLFAVDKELSYQQRGQLLLDNKIALWDVLKHCHRIGSLDSNIDPISTEVNDFASFFSRHKNIHAVFFNGTKAEQLFKRHALARLEHKNLNYQRLPSTSPAHAAMNISEKLSKWQAIKRFI